jgi:cytochrome c-type biogenesis protein CcmE
MPVSYQGSVPDPFRGGREIILTGALQNGTFVGEPESLITKCPSKFTTNASESASTGSESSSSNG